MPFVHFFPFRCGAGSLIWAGLVRAESFTLKKRERSKQAAFRPLNILAWDNERRLLVNFVGFQTRSND